MEKAKEMRSPRDRKFVRSLKVRTCAPEKQYLGIKNHNDDPRPIANPHEVSPDWKNAILHARICIGETKILGADNAVRSSCRCRRHFSLSALRCSVTSAALSQAPERRFEVSYQCHMNCDEWRQKMNKDRKEKVNLTTPI